MIASVRGPIIHLEPNSAVIEVGGLGLQVFIPLSLRDTLDLGETVRLFTTHIVRQDHMSLYGFDSLEAREIFNLLLTVNGVGPRAALSILSVLSPDAIRRAVFHEQSEVFNRVPGVGKKTAQKILLALQDRIPALDGLERAGALSDIDGEVLSALTSLGYSIVEAQSALQSVPRDAPQDVEERLRLSLKYFTSP
jgi:holliday junction DNA helicase RuvA